MTRHGLVVGKFYPPHAGHDFLIDIAASVCEDVTVVVAAADVETIPLERRLAWLRESHRHQPTVHIVGCVDNHPVDYDDPAVWDLHMNVFRSAVERSPVPNRIDAVFTAEPYGAELARRLDARWASLGIGRRPHLIAASDIRRDPPSHWDHVAPSVRAWLAKRVVVIGAESTGTTTLTEQLCQVYRRRGGPYGLTQWVPEYGRDLSWRKLAVLAARRALRGEPVPAMDDVVWTDSDFEDVAAAQNRLEDAAAAIGAPLLLCDTDSFTTRFWQHRYMGHTTPEVIAASSRSNRSLYILTPHDGVPFVQDGIRDGAHLRAEMTRAFTDGLAEQPTPYVVLDSADPEQRLAIAVGEIDALLAKGWDFGDPLQCATRDIGSVVPSDGESPAEGQRG